MRISIVLPYQKIAKLINFSKIADYDRTLLAVVVVRYSFSYKSAQDDNVRARENPFCRSRE